MSTISVTVIPFSKTVSRLAAKIKDGRDVRGSLVKLSQLDVSLVVYKQFGIEELATNIIMDSEVKTAARELVAKIRRMENATVTTTNGGDTNTERMITSKRTAPKIMAPKQKKATAQQEAPLPRMVAVVKSTENLTKYQQVRRRLAEKYQVTSALKRQNIIVEVQENAIPEPPTKKRCPLVRLFLFC